MKKKLSKYRDRGPWKMPSEEMWKNEIVPLYENGTSLIKLTKVLNMGMKCLRRELSKYTTLRGYGPRKGMKKYKLSKLGYYPDKPPTPKQLIEQGELSEEIEYKRMEKIKEVKPKRKIIHVG